LKKQKNKGALKMDKKEIERKLKELGIENYSISDDGTVDVNGTVDISFKNLTGIPVRFGIVRGDFNCSNNKLESLSGSPEKVGVSFFCHRNRLISLDSAPRVVGKAFICRSNKLTSLKGAPESINGNFDCADNELVSLTGAPRAVNGSFDCSNNKLTTLKGIPQYVQMVLYCSGNPIPGDILRQYENTSSFLIISE
jgi:hypothetical protein